MTCKEIELQCAVARYLDELDAKCGLLTFSHPPNEGLHSVHYRAKQKRQGMKTGEPDCVIYLRGGQTIFIELKAWRGRLQEGQKARHDKLRRLGYPVYVVKSKTPAEAVASVEEILKDYIDI